MALPKPCPNQTIHLEYEPKSLSQHKIQGLLRYPKEENAPHIRHKALAEQPITLTVHLQVLANIQPPLKLANLF
jgi:hypothetical protein